MLWRALTGRISEPSQSRSVIVKFAISEPQRHGEVTVLAVQGELDLASAPRLKKPLDELLRDCERGVILDLAGVTFMDSTAFSVLTQVRRRRDRTPFAIVCQDPNVLRIFAIAGFDGAFDLCLTLEEALSHLREGAASRA
jgi:anti-sigma B factor antagonist